VRATVLCGYGLHPPRSAGHLAVLAPLLRLAERGHVFEICSFGWRRGDGIWPRSHRREIAPGLTEHRVVDRRGLLRSFLGGRLRLPPLGLSETLEARIPPSLLRELEKADIWWCEGPWGYAFARKHAGGPVGLVAHNVESDLHGDALEAAGGPGMRGRAFELEGRAFLEADFVWVFHENDARRLRELHGKPKGFLAVRPLGADLPEGAPWDPRVRARARRSLDLPEDGRYALFPASAHAPNREAATWIVEVLAPRLAERGVWTAVLAGSVLPRRVSGKGWLATGPLPDLLEAFRAADLALNPMTEGSGMNLKVAECLAHGLPVLSTPFGARGYAALPEHGILLAGTDGEEGGSPRDPEAFLEILGDLEDPARLAEAGRAARAYASRALSWESIAEGRLADLSRWFEDLRIPAPPAPAAAGS